jgi:hypothetical protein
MQLSLRAMQEDRHVSGREAECLGGLGAGELLEHPESDDGALSITQLTHAPDEARVILPGFQQRDPRGFRTVKGRRLQIVVSDRTMVAPAHVACFVPDNRSQQRAQFASLSAQVPLTTEDEEPMQGLLHGIQCVVSRESLVSGNGSEVPGVRSRDLRDHVL